LPEPGRTWDLHRFPLPVGDTRFEVVDLEFEGSLERVLERDRASLVVNGGYWDPNRQPEGLTVVGERVRVGFDPALGGGVLVVRDGRARLVDAELDGVFSPTGVAFAQQCKPRLVVDGAVNIRRDDGQRADRTGLCVRDGGRTLEIAVARTGDDSRARGGPSLYAFAEALAAAGCEQALNLDGGPSSGIAWRAPDGVRGLPTRTAIRLAIVAHVEEPSREEP
jgi:uncharacterized protein YigE (DUF2233 family)